MTLDQMLERAADAIVSGMKDGGPGSGNHGHSGRPGQRGGSGGGGGSSSAGSSGKRLSEALNTVKSYFSLVSESEQLDRQARQAEKDYEADIRKWIRNDTKGMSRQQYTHLIYENGGDPSSPHREDYLIGWAKKNHPAEVKRHESRIAELYSSSQKSVEVANKLMENLRSSFS